MKFRLSLETETLSYPISLSAKFPVKFMPGGEGGFAISGSWVGKTRAIPHYTGTERAWEVEDSPLFNAAPLVLMATINQPMPDPDPAHNKGWNPDGKPYARICFVIQQASGAKYSSWLTLNDLKIAYNLEGADILAVFSDPYDVKHCPVYLDTTFLVSGVASSHGLEPGVLFRKAKNAFYVAGLYLVESRSLLLDKATPVSDSVKLSSPRMEEMERQGIHTGFRVVWNEDPGILQPAAYSTPHLLGPKQMEIEIQIKSPRPAPDGDNARFLSDILGMQDTEAFQRFLNVYHDPSVDISKPLYNSHSWGKEIDKSRAEAAAAAAAPKKEALEMVTTSSGVMLIKLPNGDLETLDWLSHNLNQLTHPSWENILSAQAEKLQEIAGALLILAKIASGMQGEARKPILSWFDLADRYSKEKNLKPIDLTRAFKLANENKFKTWQGDAHRNHQDYYESLTDSEKASVIESLLPGYFSPEAKIIDGELVENPDVDYFHVIQNRGMEEYFWQDHFTPSAPLSPSASISASISPSMSALGQSIQEIGISPEFNNALQEAGERIRQSLEQAARNLVGGVPKKDPEIWDLIKKGVSYKKTPEAKTPKKRGSKKG